MTVRKKKILVVDDSRSFLSYLTVLLKKMGFFKINLAESGMEAIGLMKIWSPDVIILDLSMPEMDGLDTLDRIRAPGLTAKVPVIMVTDSKSLRREKECYRHGADQVISKPVTLGRLNAAIQECFAISGLNRRKNLRTAFDGPVRLTHKGEENELRAAMLSEAGIFLLTNAPTQVGQRALMEFETGEFETGEFETEEFETEEFETGGLRHKLEGEVIYHASNAGSGIKGMGMALRFLNIKEKAKKQIRSFVECRITGEKKTPPGL